MKYIYSLILLILWSVLGISCVGQKEEVTPENIKLTASQETIQIGKDKAVNFQIHFNGLDVTAESEIYRQTENEVLLIENASFVPKEAGTYLFYAKYRGVQTAIVSIQVLPDEETSQSNFYRRTLITKFTATWCVNCPKMSDAIEMVKQKNPSRIIDMAVHYIDELEVPEGKNLAEQFSVSAIPVVVVNLDKDLQTSVASSTILQNYVDKILNNELAASGIKVDSYEENGLLHVDIEIKIAAKGDYKLVVALVQDEIKMTQTGASSNYTHHSVLRGILQNKTEDKELGQCNQGDILEQKYQCPTELLDKDGEYRVIVYIMNKNIDDTYVVNNVISCKTNEKTDYQYE